MLLDRPICPRCGCPSQTKHCSHYGCKWRICNACTTVKSALIFDRNNRYFIAGKGT